MPRRRQGKLNLDNRPTKKLPEQEHGDWRVALAHPEEAEHYDNPASDMMHKIRHQAAVWSSASTMEWWEAAEQRADWEPISGWPRVCRLVLGCALLPLSIVMVFALLVQLYHAAPTMGNFSFWMSEPVWYSVMGALSMVLLKFSVVADKILLYAYVLGHELTHAITAKLSGGHVSGFNIGPDGGYVETDADNLFIALSPYFVPLWMFCWLGVLWAVNFVFPFEDFAPWFYAGFGFWWAFHLYWTAWIIPREQPDMLSNGIVCSAMLIMLMNLLVLLAVLRSFGVMTLRGYAEDFVRCAQEVGAFFCDIGLWLWELLSPYLA